MSETQKYTAPKAVYKPGELDSTRKNIGQISPEEARRMANLLGGEVGVEQVPEFAPIKRTVYDKSARPSTAPINRSSAGGSDKNASSKRRGKSLGNSSAEGEKKEKPSVLPVITKKEQGYFDRLMASSEYKIKRNRSLFAILFSMGKNQDKVAPEFVSVRLLNHVSRMDKFFAAVTNLVNTAESDFRLKVQTYETDKYKFFRFASTFSMVKIKNMQKELAANPENVTVSDMVPFIKEIYRPLLKIFYLGEERIITFIKEALTEISSGRKSVQSKLMPLVKEASAEWIYVYHQVIKGLYPLLMRMCSTEMQPFARFFNKNTSKILEFLGLTKFDLILPDADPKEAEKKEAERIKEEEKQAKAKKEGKDLDEEEVEEVKDADGTHSKRRRPFPAAIQQSLKTLEMIFPDAGWQNLGNGTDMFPYFQPLYKFSDGYNLLSIENPMQVTIALLRILEDFFQGVRNIHFLDNYGGEDKKGSDSFFDIFADWSAYQEIVFERDYLPTMKEIVNHVSTQSDFISTPYARKQIASVLWETRTMFLPFLNYDYFFMEKEIRTSPYKPLPRRVDFLKDKITEILQACDEERKACAIQGRPFSTEHIGIDNIMRPYSFAMENVVSRRLNVLISQKNRSNLTLLKYTYSVLLVLHWWISDPKSPAYEMSTLVPYRTNVDGTLLFSVPTRTDLNSVFTRSVKMRQAELMSKSESAAGNAPSATASNQKAAPAASAQQATKPVRTGPEPSALKMATDAIKISDVNSTKDLPDLDAVGD